MAHGAFFAPSGRAVNRGGCQGTFLLSGTGDVIEPDDGICAIGSGGPYALAAARALSKYTKLSAKDIAQEAMRIASEICIFTNANFSIEEL